MVTLTRVINYLDSVRHRSTKQADSVLVSVLEPQKLYLDVRFLLHNE